MNLNTNNHKIFYKNLKGIIINETKQFYIIKIKQFEKNTSDVIDSFILPLFTKHK